MHASTHEVGMMMNLLVKVVYMPVEAYADENFVYIADSKILSSDPVVVHPPDIR